MLGLYFKEFHVLRGRQDVHFPCLPHSSVPLLFLTILLQALIKTILAGCQQQHQPLATCTGLRDLN